MRKVVTFYGYDGEIRTGRKIRLYYVNGVVQNVGSWTELMAVTAEKLDYRAERFTYSGGTYPEYTNHSHLAAKVVRESEAISSKPMTASEILDLCNRRSTKTQDVGENGVVKAHRGRPRKNVIKIVAPVLLDAEGNVIKRKRGRPRKIAAPVPALAA